MATSVFVDKASVSGRYPFESSTNVTITPYSSTPGVSLSSGGREGRTAYLQEMITLLFPEDGELPISEFALDQAWSLVDTVTSFMASGQKGPRIVDDGDGGIRMTWRNKGREIRIALAANPADTSYLYREEGSSFELIPNFTKVTLLNQLTWLYGG